MAQIKIAVDVDGTGAVKGFQDVGGAAQSALSAIGLQSVTVGNLLSSGITAALDMAKRAAAALIEEAGRWVKASMEQQDSTEGLRAVLVAANEDADRLTTRYTALAESLQDVTRFADDAIQGGIGRLVSIGRVNEQQMERTTRAALDMAAALKMDVDSAFAIVAKAAAGNTDMLGRYGIKVEKGATANETLANTLAALEGKFKGAAEAGGKTMAGSLDILSHAIEEMRETLGDVLNLGLAPLIEMAGNAAKAIKGFMDANKPELTLGLANAVRAVADAFAFLAPWISRVIKDMAGLADMLGVTLRNMPGLSAEMKSLGQAMSAGADSLRKLSADVEMAPDRMQRLADGIAHARVATEKHTEAVADDNDVMVITARLNAQAKAELAMVAKATGEATAATEQLTAARKVANGAIDDGSYVYADLHAWLEQSREDFEGVNYAASELASNMPGFVLNYKQAAVATDAMSEAAERYRKEVEAIQKIVVSRDIGTEEKMDFDVNSKEVQGALAMAKTLQKNLSSTPILQGFVDAFLRNVGTGDVGALENLVKAVRAQQAIVTAPGSSIGMAPGESLKVQSAWTGLADVLSGALAALRRIGDAPGRAFGGQVTAGQPYVVGEDGPEPFIPSSNGTILPNHFMAATNAILREILHRGQSVTVNLDGRAFASVMVEHIARNEAGRI